MTNQETPPNNASIANQFDEVAELLDVQNANPFRVQAYLNAARTLRSLDRAVADILASEGIEGLEQLPHIGSGLAATIDQIVHDGRLPLLERLRGETSSLSILTTVPGIGKRLAERIHEELGIGTLAELEQAAHHGRLDEVEGIGPKRLRGIRESLAGRFRRTPGRSSYRRKADIARDQTPISEILSVDEEYRTKASKRELPQIAPRRFNPTHESWLPILHTTRDDRHYTALFSNTARAHELGMTDDWVVIYRDDSGSGTQWTVVTARYGPLEGRRIVRGREVECRAHYDVTS
ncbi:MAG: helix-hairpin-helix domain-containing protein [Rhodothermales bacterium]